MATPSLRPATAEDREFLLALFASTRAELIALLPLGEQQKRAFVEQQFDAQERDYRSRHPDVSFDVVTLEGRPVGRLSVSREADELLLLDVSLLPEVRGRGIGTLLLRALADEARASGRALTLHADRENPARRLYERLGLRAVEEGDVHVRMELRGG